MLKKLKLLKKPLFQKRRWSCDFPPRKTRVAQKYRAISCQEKMAFSTPVGLSWHSLPPPRVCADGRAYSLRSRRIACVAGVNGEGEGEREKMEFCELGTRERLLQRPHFFISAHQFLCNPIKLSVNATTNQTGARFFA